MARYIKIWENIRKSKLWPETKFSKFEAWIDLILMANGEDCEWKGIKIKRGCLVTSQRKLAKKWGWSATTVNRFIDILVDDERVKMLSDVKHFLEHQNLEISEQQTKHLRQGGFTFLELTNYNKYNSVVEHQTEQRNSENVEQKVVTNNIDISIRGSRKKEVELAHTLLRVNNELRVIVQHCVRYLNLEEFSPKDIQMLRDLLEKYGEKLVLERIIIADEIRNDDFAPVITSVQNLRDKWLNIEAHIARKKNKVKKQYEESENESVDDLRKDLGVAKNIFGKIIS